MLETEQLIISPIVHLELSYLHEIERLKVGGADIVGDLTTRRPMRWQPTVRC